ncbi:VOC family protein [Bacillus sp. SG-1]|uniref:VOC family protein n=1 Tax=Bacillus sp. SG-1 TaxID=161544 RepID=UPI00015430B6|nr:hypothetical protein [Bacillus sp. SG-1]EDL66093.1 Acetyltransferase [Bacillus sp. SG-1]
MNLVVFKDAKKFDEEVRPLLVKEEAENNLPLGLLDQITGGRYEDSFLAVMKDQDTIQAVFVRTPPHFLIVTVFDEGKTEEIGQVLWNYVQEHGIHFPGFIGNKKVTLPLAEFWKEKTNTHFEVNMRQRIYKLDHVNDIDISEGKMELAGPEHVDLVTEWILGFVEDTPENPIPKDVYTFDMDSSYLTLDSNIVNQGEFEPSKYPICNIACTNIQEVWDRFGQLGIDRIEQITRFPNLSYFNFKDPDGNVLMMCSE